MLPSGVAVLSFARASLLVQCPDDVLFGNPRAVEMLVKEGGRRLELAGFDQVELIAFRDICNSMWLIERHGFQLPTAIRAEQLSIAALAA